MRLILLAALIAPVWAAHGAEIPADGDRLDPADGPSWIISPAADEALPDALYLAGSEVHDITVHAAGVLIINDNGSVDPTAPGALDGLPGGGVIAPFWAGGCAAGEAVGGEVRRSATPAGLRISWHGVGGCRGIDGAEATFSVELRVHDGDLVGFEFRYGALPGETPAVEPRAGYRLPDDGGGNVAFELLPDPAAGQQRGRAKLLEAGSSDGEPGVWLIELGADGRLLGDPDADGRRSIDNCERDFNPLQADNDGQEGGDACDIDDDNDRVLDPEDNCPFSHNRSQADLDRDGLGDACDPDDDDDGLLDARDRCPRDPEPANLDLDDDGLGDACDPDPDGDDREAGRLARPPLDLCPWTFDPLGGDGDKDGLGDACDLRPRSPCGLGCRWQSDADGDGVGDVFDRCPWTPDPEQGDLDGDGIGDACDPDGDGDGVLDDDPRCLRLDCGPFEWAAGIEPDWRVRR